MLALVCFVVEEELFKRTVLTLHFLLRHLRVRWMREKAFPSDSRPFIAFVAKVAGFFGSLGLTDELFHLLVFAVEQLFLFVKQLHLLLFELSLLLGHLSGRVQVLATHLTVLICERLQESAGKTIQSLGHFKK